MTEAYQNQTSQLIGDYSVFYQKVRFFHWTVKGPQFFHLHELFEKLYLEAAETVDVLAERMVAQGATPPASLRELLGNARLEEHPQWENATTMVELLAKDLSFLTDEARQLATIANDQEDPASANFLEELADGQEKTLWMLKAFLA